MHPVIVGGHGRSGTTFLTRCIGSHPCIVGQGHESHLFPDRLGLMDLVEFLSTNHKPSYPLKVWKDIRAFIKFQTLSFLSVETKKLNGGEKVIEKRISQFFNSLERKRYALKGTKAEKKGLNTNILVDCLTLEEAYLLVEHYCQQWFDVYKKITPYTHWIEKTPRNVLMFNKLSKVFPDAKLIHIHRDPKDVIDSTAIHNWSPHGIEYSIYMYKNWLTRWEMVCDEVRTHPNYLEISYREFCDNSQIWNNIFDHMGLDCIPRPNISCRHVGRYKSTWKSEHYRLFNDLIKDRAKEQGFLEE